MSLNTSDARALRHVFGRDRLAPQSEDLASFHQDQTYHAPPPPNGHFPFHFSLEAVLGPDAVTAITKAGELVFHAVGDTGNKTHGAEAQEALAHHMVSQLETLTGAKQPKFFYHLGDVVYFCGAPQQYGAQFYEPYQHYTAPILPIAGNHDGAIGEDGVTESLKGFAENFCSPQPLHSPFAGTSNRTTMTLPNVYWTLLTPLVTIIGLYSNVNGHLDKANRNQEDWFVNELKTAKQRGDKCVLVAVHHPPYSLDSSHGGTSAVRVALERSFAAADLIPTAVLTAHVHNYQRFEMAMGQRKVPYLVIGAGGYGGYDGLHQLNPNAAIPPGAKLIASETQLPGFLKIAVTRKTFTAEYYTVPRPPGHLTGAVKSVDSFTVNL